MIPWHHVLIRPFGTRAVALGLMLCVVLQTLLPGMHALVHQHGQVGATAGLPDRSWVVVADHDADCPVCALLQHVVQDGMTPAAPVPDTVRVVEAWAMMMEMAEAQRRPDVRANPPRGPPVV